MGNYSECEQKGNSAIIFSEDSNINYKALIVSCEINILKYANSSAA